MSILPRHLAGNYVLCRKFKRRVQGHSGYFMNPRTSKLVRW
jgi:hypothetical protein